MINTHRHPPTRVHYDEDSGDLTPLYPLMQPHDANFSTMLTRIKRMALRSTESHTTSVRKYFQVTPEARLTIIAGGLILSATLSIKNHKIIPRSQFLLFSISSKNTLNYGQLRREIIDCTDITPFSDQDIESELIDFLVDYTPYELEELVDLVD